MNDFSQYDFSDVVVRHVLPLLKGGGLPATVVVPAQNSTNKCYTYTPCPEKRDQNVFCNISYKTRAIVMKFGTQSPE